MGSFLAVTSNIKPRPNDRNISTRHIATLLGATYCVRLATLLRRVTTCDDMLGVAASNLKMAKFFMQHLTLNDWSRGEQRILFPENLKRRSRGKHRDSRETKFTVPQGTGH